jgi:hypothetical protein
MEDAFGVAEEEAFELALELRVDSEFLGWWSWGKASREGDTPVIGGPLAEVDASVVKPEMESD